MFEELQLEIKKIKERNLRVEGDKAWETSKTRIACIAALTYFMMVVLMVVIGVDDPFLSALVPTAGFVLSSLSLRFAKEIWLRHIYAKKK